MKGNRRWLSLVLILAAFVGCTAKRQVGDVSVAELSARPREFDHKKVAVIGYYSSGMEESALYSSTSSGPENWFAIWVEPGWRKSVYRITNRYVRVVGIFHYRPDAAVYPGELSDITSFRPLR